MPQDDLLILHYRRSFTKVEKMQVEADKRYMKRKATMPSEHCLQRPQQPMSEEYALKCMAPDCDIPIERESNNAWLLR